MRFASPTATLADSEYDLVIVGSGGASMCAALVALQLGKRPVILEKLSKIGGSTGYSGGVWWVPNNPLMAREGVADSHQRGRQYMDAVIPAEGPATSPVRREAFLKNGPPMIEFLERAGMRFFRPDGWSDYYDERAGGSARSRSLMAEIFNVKELGEWQDRLSVYPPFMNLPMVVQAHEGALLLMMKRTWAGKRMVLKVIGRTLIARLLGRKLVANGGAIQGRMLQLALRAGVPIFPDTGVKDLIVAGGRVVGVVAERAGQEIRVRARDAVLVNCGGFARNAQMRTQYQRQPLSATAATPGDTGEVIQAAMRHGAATTAMDAGWWLLTSRGTDGRWPEGALGADGQTYPFLHSLDIAAPYSIIVDQDGQRYINECSSYVEQGETLYRRQQQTGKAVPSWLIMDARNRRWYGLGLTPPGVMPQQWLDSGYMKKAESLDALAALCGVDSVGLQTTVTRFNGFCRTGVDEDFQRGARQYDRWRGDPTVKPNPNLGPIEEGPFYAVAIYPCDVGTAGGLLTDEYARVLRDDASIIEGLYAAGNCTASVMGHTYPGAGASIAASFVFGYIAAHHCAGASAGRHL